MKYQCGVDQVELNKKDRRKIIVTTVVFAILILVIIVWLIVSAVNGSKPQDAAKTDVQTTQEAQEAEQLADQPTEVKPAEDAVATAEPAQHVATTETSISLPSTGPEEIIPLALVAGALATFATSSYLVKKNML